MDRANWKKKIVKHCKDAGTYKPFFGSVIDTLAGIMESRDLAQKKYIEAGGMPTVERTNRAGDVNIYKNPALEMVLECNSQALSYWRDLGLTSKSWQAMMKEERLNGEKKDNLEDVLKGLGV